jgi:glycosyltransferase involved in cell wall biosynthesis
MDREQDQKSLRVSVIVPTFNRRTWIGECLDSILSQTYSNIEIIVVDDCSTDDTVEWLKGQSKYQGIKLHVQEKNGGASIARNTAIEMAVGDLIVFIDSDDALLPNHVESAVSLFEKNPEMGLFCCDSKMIDAEGNIILGGKTWHEALRDAKGVDVHSGFRSLQDVFRFSNCFPGFTLRREVFEKLGGFDQSIFPADDYDLALRVAGSEYKVYYLHEPLCLRREHDAQCSGIQNSVKTQVKLIEALQQAAERNPKILGTTALVRRRMGAIEMELGICLLKEGDKASGVKTLLGSVLSRPSQIAQLARIGGRRLKAVAKTNK